MKSHHDEVSTIKGFRPLIVKHGLAYSINRNEFGRQTVNQLRLARAALIYLSLGVHAEEHRTRTARGDTTVPGMPLDTWRDEWKV